MRIEGEGPSYGIRQTLKGTEPIKRRLLSIDEAGAYLDLSIHTLYTMCSQRRIPFVKMGRLTKFDLQQLDKWIEKNTVMPAKLPHTRG